MYIVWVMHAKADDIAIVTHRLTAQDLRMLVAAQGKTGQNVRDNEWLMSIRGRTIIPGGACEFDLPSYYAWQQRPAEQRSPAWIDRHLTKVTAALAAMSHGLGDKAWCSGNHFSLADIAVGCALSWLEFRFPEITWRETHPNLARHMDKLAARQSFLDTAPPTA